MKNLSESAQYKSAAVDSLRVGIDADAPALLELFEHLHAHPELSMQEFSTSDRLAAELEALGYTLTRKINVTGLVGTLQNGDGPVVMIRADMDALPILEKTGLPYASRVRQVNHEGDEVPVMHACGHDMHTTALVGVARRLVAMQDQWRGTVLMLGQPAEEALGGAAGMVSDGLYERVGRPDYALALHVIPKYPVGKVAFSKGLMYSSVDTVRIIVRGVGTHGAAPHIGKDPVVIGSQIVLALQTIISREISPLEPALITVGAFHAGYAPNVIPDHAVLDLTVRSNNEITRAQLLASIRRVAAHTAKAAGICEHHLPEVIVDADGAPTTTNTPEVALRVRNAMEAGMGAEALTEWFQSDMGAEDFPGLVNLDPPIPCVYFEVGCTPAAVLDTGTYHETHSPLFKVEPEATLKTCVHAMTLAALELLGKP